MDSPTAANTMDLEAPLIEKSGSQHQDDQENCKKPLMQATSFPKTRFNILSLGTGMFVGLLSEVLLSATIWDSAILSQPLKDLAIFSLVWSLLTTLLVNFSMHVFLQDLKETYRGMSKNKRRVMEVFCIGGALLSISVWWVLLDCLNILLPLSPAIVAALVVSATLLYLVFLAVVLPDTGTCTSARKNYILSCLFGLVGGFCSQLALSAIIWKYLPQSASQNLVVFSFVWSAFSVAVTFSGCVVLRCFKPAPCDQNKVASERAYLRMESAYVLCSLIGICFAWITLYLVLDFPTQIVPSFLMLLMSLIVFRAILYLFPEDKCLEEMTPKENPKEEEV